MADGLSIQRLDAWQVEIPLARPYHLSKVYGTITHGKAVVVCITLENGVIGWGEADPGGMRFTHDTAPMVMDAIKAQASALIGHSVSDWVRAGKQQEFAGSAQAAVDVACYDAYARATAQPLWALLGELERDAIPSLWPTSSGSADDDLADIKVYAARGFSTFMLKMGDRPIDQELPRLREVISRCPADARIMVDANQGWSRTEADGFFSQLEDIDLILAEQPLKDTDLDGLAALRQRYATPISADESVRSYADVQQVIAAGAADIVSIKVSKNGGFSRCLPMTAALREAGINILMNSMLEFGITQAASLHLGCTLNNLVDCGHAYMSTIRMSDDITDFSDWVKDGTAHLRVGAEGLGVVVSTDKIKQYSTDYWHVDA